MANEIFRFVTVRPPQDLDSLKASTDATIDLGAFPTPLTDTLRALRSDGDRVDMLSTATAFIASAAFIDSPRKISKTHLDFMVAVRALTEQNFWVGAGQAFTTIFKAPAADVVRTGAFVTFYGQTSDSIVAATIDASVSPKVRALLTTTARSLFLIRRLATATQLTPAALATAPLVLPHDIFPLPAGGAGLAAGQKAAAEANKAKLDARDERLAQLTADLTAHRRAVEELLTTLGEAGARPSPRSAVNSANIAAAQAGSPTAVGFALPDSAAERLTQSTKDVLSGLGMADGPVDVAKAVAALENQAVDIAKRLYLAAGADPTDTRSPGPCPPTVPATIPDGTVSVPTGHGDAKILGIADLMVLEQDISRYELGEIAHIENVLKSETRSRTFKTSTTTEQTQTTETETTQTKEQDLSSTERFELQSESQTVINDNASKDAGLTIHASYGPSVDATSNFNFSSASSRQQSNTASSTYAREITTKAVNRVQTRTLTRRVVSTINVIEEVNQHGFDNKSGNNDIVGVYRFVDKIYRAQVINYGKRLMLEFVVPEPAAFLRFAMTHRPVDGVTQVEPDQPGYCLANGTSFVALQATDITRENYLFWASKYGAQDVTSPPPSVILASGAKKSPDSMPAVGDRLISSDLMDVAIADGYLAQNAFINIFGETQAGDHRLVYQVQEQQGLYVEPVDDGHLFPLRLQPTPTVTVSINTVGFHNYEILALVLCTLSVEKFQEWQVKTFNSIMNAYNDAKSRFDQAVAEARLRAGDNVVSGTNPLTNRETEQTELKKACISLLTGQRFDLFDAVHRNVAPLGYPEIDFAEAKAEGAYIQVFEQSFEWNNMTYVFYPYFWGKKDEWPTVSQLTDNDPLFARFLRAGAGRVQVPVRLGFEQSVLTYLATGELWSGDGTLVNSDGDTPDQLHLSILDELKSQLGDNNVEGAGTVNVTHNSVNVTGNATGFTADDEDRRIQIAGKTYVVKTVVDDHTIRLSTNYTGDNATGLGYSMGGKLIGEPFEVKVPTDLIKLDNSLVIN